MALLLLLLLSCRQLFGCLLQHQIGLGQLHVGQRARAARCSCLNLGVGAAAGAAVVPDTVEPAESAQPAGAPSWLGGLPLTSRDSKTKALSSTAHLHAESVVWAPWCPHG
jgi:hypothetical protein